MTYRRVVVVELLILAVFLSIIAIDRPSQRQQPLDRPPRMFLAGEDSYVEGAIGSFCRQRSDGRWRCVERPVQAGSFPTRAALTTLRVDRDRPLSIRFAQPQPISDLGLFGPGSDPAMSLQNLRTPRKISYRAGDGPWKTVRPKDRFLPPSVTKDVPLVFRVRWDRLNVTYVFQLDTNGEQGVGVEDLLPR